MKYKAVIFDLDGTLLDTVEDIATSVNNVLKSKGQPVFPLEIYKKTVGTSLRQLVQDLIPNSFLEDDELEEFIRNVRGEYAKNWNNKTKPYEGIEELLEALEDKGIRISVLSNKLDEFTVLSMEHYFKDWNFYPVFGSRSNIPLKPDPASALEICGLMRLKPSDILFLGDTNVDMMTAKNSGMTAIGALWGFRPKEELQEAGADYLINHPGEMIQFFV